MRRPGAQRGRVSGMPQTGQRLISSDGETVEVTVDLAESPLVWLASRKDKAGRPLISPIELMAGERLRRDYETAGFAGRTTMNWSALGGPNERRISTGGGIPADVAIDARQRTQAALDALGPDLGAIAVDVCCLRAGLSGLETANGWPQRSGKIILRLALAALARHYGLGDRTEGRASHRMRSWTAADRAEAPAPQGSAGHAPATGEDERSNLDLSCPNGPRLPCGCVRPSTAGRSTAAGSGVRGD